MKTNIDVIARSIASFVNGESAPPMMSPEFMEVMTALAGLKTSDFQAIGTNAAMILLFRMQAGMVAERTLKIICSEDNPMRPN